MLHTDPSNNGPLRGGKGDTYEGGIRVPAVMQWPGVIPPNSGSHESAVHFDIFTTILTASGVAVPAKNGAFPVHGLNLLPLLRDPPDVKLADRYLFWDLYGDVAALHSKWKMVGQISNHHGKFGNAAVEAEAAKFELYNLDEDPSETTDVSEQFSEVYADLKARHLQWLRQFANAGANGGIAKAVSAGDIDGDGRPDLVFSCEQAIFPRHGLVWFKARWRHVSTLFRDSTDELYGEIRHRTILSMIERG